MFWTVYNSCSLHDVKIILQKKKKNRKRTQNYPNKTKTVSLYNFFLQAYDSLNYR